MGNIFISNNTDSREYEVFNEEIAIPYPGEEKKEVLTDGPVKEGRSCTDVICCLLFLVYFITC